MSVAFTVTHTVVPCASPSSATAAAVISAVTGTGEPTLTLAR